MSYEKYGLQFTTVVDYTFALTLCITQVKLTTTKNILYLIFIIVFVQKMLGILSLISGNVSDYWSLKKTPEILSSKNCIL